MQIFDDRWVKLFLAAAISINAFWSTASARGQEAEPAESAVPTQDEPRDGQQSQDDTQSKAKGIEVQANGSIRFKFVDAPWSDVIQFFAEQAGFSLQPIEAGPDGTFKYHDDQEYTVMEALDQLNYALALRGFTLVRNKRLLVLVSTERNIPDDLIETVAPAELDGRGKHEILKCVFDLEGLEESQIESQIEALISRTHNDGFHVIPSANQMIVREKGQTLRTIRLVLETARTKFGENRFVVGKHQLKHIDPESMLEAARLLLSLDANNQSSDGHFKVMVQPLSTELIFRGSPDKVKNFEKLLAQLDVADSSANSTSVERPFLKRYPLSGDLDMAFKVINALMAGRDVKFEIDKTTAQAILSGREDDHRQLQEIISELSSGGDDFAVLDLKYITTTKATENLDQLYRREEDGDNKTPVQGPVYFADKTSDRLIIKGTPQEVAAVKRYIEQLDVEVNLNDGPRSKTRIISLDGTSVSPNYLEDLLQTTGRKNRLEIFMPKDLKPRGAFDEYSQPEPDPTDQQEPQSTEVLDSIKSGWNRLRDAATFAAFRYLPSLLPTVLVAIQEPTTSASDEQDEPKSIPGAKVDVKITEYGIVITSDDLDALDEYEALIRNEFATLSTEARSAVFYLKYRDPKDAKSILEKLIGQGSSSSGAADPLSSLIGAGVNNMIPGMGDLFGGGSSSGSSGEGVFKMEGDVVILADSEMRALIIGANAADMDKIEPLIMEYIDQPGAPHDPKVQGDFYTIPVIHHDPLKLKEMITSIMPDMIRSEADANQAAQGQGPEQQILQRLMQARGGGQQQADEELEAPKAILGVDETSRNLLVFGPPFIYEIILNVVQKLDVPELSQSSYVIMPLDGRNAQLIGQSLKAALGDKIVISDPTATQGSGQPTGTPNATQNTGPGAQQAQQQADARNQMIQMMQQMNRGGGQRQQNNRGNQGDRGGQGGGQQGGFRGNQPPGGGG